MRRDEIPCQERECEREREREKESSRLGNFIGFSIGYNALIEACDDILGCIRIKSQSPPVRVIPHRCQSDDPR